VDRNVQQALFTITCPTCRVRLAVRSAEAVGAILECPKCGCMVPVTPPDGWQPPKPPETPTVQPSPERTSQSPPSSGPTAKPPVSQPESGTAASAAGSDSTLDSGSLCAEGKPFRLWHSWQIIAAAPIAAAAIGVVVWLTMFSGIALNSSVRPAVGQSNDNPPDKPVAKPAAENSAEAKSLPGPETSQSKTPELKEKEPEQNPTETKTSEPKTPEPKTAEVNTPEATAAAGEKNPPAEAESRQNKQNKEPPAPVMGTSKLVKLLAPEAIDVQSRLAEVIPGIELREMPFARAIGLLTALSGLPITIDPDAVARLQVSLRDPITIRLTGATLEEILQEIVAKRGMAYTAEDGQVVVTGPADQREKLRRIRYTVSDLTDNDKAAADRLAALVQKLISPQSWQAAGGEGTVETEKTALIVTQTAAVHDRILVFCEKLRNARGRPLKSNRDPKRFDLTTRHQQAASPLNRPITANFHEPATLVDILAYLGRQAEIDILLDRQALGAAGMSDMSEISFAVDNRPLAAALDELLLPLKLGYRPIDAHTLQVTTQSALDARLDLEFYPVGKILGKELAASDLIEQIKTAVSPASWIDAGSLSAIYFDQSSASLIVLQSPPIQAAIQAFLTKRQQD